VHDDALDIFEQTAPLGGCAVEGEPDGGGDVQPLQLAADPKAAVLILTFSVPMSELIC